MATDAATSKTDKLIRDNAVMVFSKTYCPHCRHSMRVLRAKQKEYEARGTPFDLEICELDELENATGSAMQDHLAGVTGARTVPRIFVATEVLGGRSDLDEAMEDGVGRSLDGYWLRKAVEYSNKTATAGGA